VAKLMVERREVRAVQAAASRGSYLVRVAAAGSRLGFQVSRGGSGRALVTSPYIEALGGGTRRWVAARRTGPEGQRSNEEGEAEASRSDVR
jgi:hypothetical protein